MHNQRVVQSGQSWQQGPIILNWLDIQDSFDASGFNLIVHEVAHKLDTRNGDRASGVPLIPLREVAGWEHDLHAAMENIRDEIDLVGESAASIDAYAATDPAECFAVLSEYFLAPRSYSHRVSRPCGNVFVIFISRIPCSVCAIVRVPAAPPSDMSTRPLFLGYAQPTVPLSSRLKQQRHCRAATIKNVSPNARVTSGTSNALTP